MNFVAVAIVSAIVLGNPLNKRVVFWICLNCILFCLNNSSQIAKKPFGNGHLRSLAYCYLPLLMCTFKVSRQQPRLVMHRPSLKILTLRKWLIPLSVCMIIEICKKHLVLNINSNINIITDI